MIRTTIAGIAMIGAGVVGVAAMASPAVQAGDAAKGKAVFARCAACHSLAPGKNGIGPSLAGIVGRKAGSMTGYRYSPAMQKSGLTWDGATIAKFVAGPSKLVPGTKMMAPAVSNPADQANLVAFLKTQGAK